MIFYFLKQFFPNIRDKEIYEISNLKDNLFIDYLNDYNKDIMVNGVKEFIKKQK